MPEQEEVRTLYLCYFGIREPLVQTQVLPYLRELGRRGIEVSLLTFEPELKSRWTKPALKKEQERLASEDSIRWLYLPYHKRPSVPATVYDILRGAWTAIRLARKSGIDVLHARSHVPMAMALLARPFTGCRLIFDIRGLLAEEYMDAGIWTKESMPFRVIKWLERVGIRRADQLVVLTRRMRDWLVEEKMAVPEKIEVIPCCVDFARYDKEQKSAGLSNEAAEPSSGRFEMIYAGSVTGLYLLEEMGRLFLELQRQRPDAFFRILTASSAEDAGVVLRRAGLRDEDFHVARAAPQEVPLYMNGARMGISFRKPAHSQIAASPTKIPEYLAAGLPVICNARIGDMDELLEREGVGAVVRDFTQEEYRRVVERALSLASDAEIRERSKRVARDEFDLIQVGGRGYYNVYQRLGAKQRAIQSSVKDSLSF